MDFFERIDPELREGLALYDMIGLAQHQRLEGDVIAAVRAQGDGRSPRCWRPSRATSGCRARII